MKVAIQRDMDEREEDNKTLKECQKKKIIKWNDDAILQESVERVGEYLQEIFPRLGFNDHLEGSVGGARRGGVIALRQ